MLISTKFRTPQLLITYESHINSASFVINYTYFCKSNIFKVFYSNLFFKIQAGKTKRDCTQTIRYFMLFYNSFAFRKIYILKFPYSVSLRPVKKPFSSRSTIVEMNNFDGVHTFRCVLGPLKIQQHKIFALFFT